MRKTLYHHHHLFTLLFIFFGLLLLAYSLQCGVGLTYDSYDYLAAAFSFSERWQLIDNNGKPYIFHAPLFPILISILGNDPVQKVKILNHIFYLISIIFIYLGNFRLFKNPWFSSLSILTIGISVGHQMIYNYIWSEPLFLFLFVIHNYLMLRFLRNPKKNIFIGLIFIAFLMCLIRNAGFFIILASGYILLLNTSKAVRNFLSYMLFSSSGFLLWNSYVIFVQNGINRVYAENPFFTGVFHNSINYLDIISLWFFPGLITSGVRVSLLLIILILLWIVLKYQLVPKSGHLYFAQFVIYLILMIVLIKVDIDEIERLLAVIYPWMVVGIFLIIDENWNDIKPKAHSVIKIGLVIWICYLGVRSVKNCVIWHDNHCNKSIIYKKGKLMDYQLQ